MLKSSLLRRLTAALLVGALTVLPLEASAGGLGSGGGGGPLAAGSNIVGKVGVDQTTPGTTNGVNLLTSYRNTYQDTVTAYAAYATPTDMACVWGSGSKTVAVVQFSATMQSTSATLQTIYWVKRSTVDTSGTPTSYTATAVDSTEPAATATVTSYGSAPSTGTSVGNLDVQKVATSVLTSTAALSSVGTYLSLGTPISQAAPIVLHGTGEGVCFNYNGAALTSGFLADFHIQWVEY